jgi:TetR/AcrR family transcriptional regulator, transcriptional repressor for nem operon
MTDTREQIIELAMELLQQRGFNGFSYKDIAEQLGVKNAAVHYHFPNKSDLGVALAQTYQQRFRRYTAKFENASWLEKFEAYLAIPVTFVRQGRSVCPLGVLEAEFFTLPEAVQKAAKSLDQEMRGWLSKVLEQGRQAGEFHFNGSAGDKALLITAAGQGALQIARAAGTSAFYHALRQIKTDMGLREKT